MFKINYLFAIIAVFFWSSCDIINPEEPTPAILEIAPFTFSTDGGSEGSASNNISEVWVTVGGSFLGVYDLPASVPVIASGQVDIKLEAGIRENGISATPNIYPFYEAYEVTRELVPGETISLTPSTRYLNTTKFAFIEDFEEARPRRFTQTILGETQLFQSSEDVFEGAFSGHLSLVKETRPIVEIVTNTSFSDLQEEGVFVYLEVDYKSEAPVAWGIYNPGSLGMPETASFENGFLPKAEWNKIYFNLSQLIFDSQLDEYQIGLQGLLLDPELPDSANVFIDNIKLVHF